MATTLPLVARQVQDEGIVPSDDWQQQGTAIVC